MARKTKARKRGSSGSGPADFIGGLPGYDPFDQADGYYFDEAAAQFAIDFIEQCIRHAKGKLAGKPFLLAPWQKALVANLFGWKGEADELRRYREALIYVGKKNGKTALVAAILLLVLMTDQELGAELYSAAASRDQAGLVFAHVYGMIRQEPELSNRLTVYGAQGGSQQRAVVYGETMSAYKCLSADANTADGASPTFVAIDEVHRHRTPELAEVLQKSTAARTQPLVLYLTTADYNRPSLCNTLLARAKEVRDNRGDRAKPGYDPSFLPVVYEATKNDDWSDPATWAKANPNLGVTISHEFMERECRKAKEIPTQLNNFLRLHLNIVTDASESFLDMESWDACGAPGANPEDLEGRECFAGLDLATTTDVASLVLLFPRDDGGYDVLPYFWVPKDNAAKRQSRDRVPYLTWIERGLISATEGNVIDYDVIRRDINDLGRQFNIREIAVDRWNATQISTQLQGDGFEVVEYGQGFSSMSAPTKELEKLVLGNQIGHVGNAVLRWMAGNTVAERDAAGNIKPSKKKSTERIDGIVALIMAIGRAMVRPERQSAYESRGFVTV